MKLHLSWVVSVPKVDIREIDNLCAIENLFTLFIFGAKKGNLQILRPKSENWFNFHLPFGPK